MEYKLRFEDYKGNILKEDIMILSPNDTLVITVPSAMPMDEMVRLSNNLIRALEKNKPIIIMTDDIKIKILRVESGEEVGE